MIRRRLFAALILFAFAVGSALFWDGGEVDWFTIGTNLAVAAIGLVFLHFRWRTRERRALTPNKAKDVFS
ncbi:MAG: hypothetical protein QNJ15_12305 [Erythrobacter sp.]|nr:hypothetical protein [Erythrobacter sp.]